jgi:hypothetical protein
MTGSDADKSQKMRREGSAARSFAEGRIDMMSKSIINAALHNEETLTDALPDVALEVAASQYTGLAFFTGFSSCPFGAPDRAANVAKSAQAQLQSTRQTTYKITNWQIPM